jgi:transcriptional regulator with PAS, ATPase and Fis domain
MAGSLAPRIAPLTQLRKDGSFRDDFYCRLCSDTITLPPLRDRIREDRDELRQLMRSLVQCITGDTKGEVFSVVFETLKADLPPSYPWTGNVRELAQTVHRILITRCYTPDAVPSSASEVDALHQDLENCDLSANALLSAYRRLLRGATTSSRKLPAALNWTGGP